MVIKSQTGLKAGDTLRRDDKVIDRSTGPFDSVFSVCETIIVTVWSCCILSSIHVNLAPTSRFTSGCKKKMPTKMPNIETSQLTYFRIFLLARSHHRGTLQNRDMWWYCRPFEVG